MHKKEIAIKKGSGAIITISVDTSVSSGKIAKTVFEIPGVKRVFEVSGAHDITAIISAPDNQGINEIVDKIRGIFGITNTDTMIVLNDISRK
ncbi:MAG: Lrp/AsnC ligand binding domain-containing protein [Candidatus Micrarchaeota archaeon]|nr:Lrp/AsnC ligand binding domain-containing protein [Candidatus Micrarchaeota archaeon]MDE1847400.1 Lrp/AsnC ligand binding domain-containing protein [Candidatus Micrarchaeota archaeon]MDE1864015.1 Lrp/AsnC ligand binding domain-containing protein [Candidatus Micrarchaeota archaeon]